MTKDSDRKRAIRRYAAEHGISYTAAMRALQAARMEKPPSQRFLDSIVAEFTARGWPVDVPYQDAAGVSHLPVGPGLVKVTPLSGAAAGLHATFVAPASVAQYLRLREPVLKSEGTSSRGTIFPLDPAMRPGAMVSLNPNDPPSELVSACNQALLIGRHEAFQAGGKQRRIACGDCGTRYSASHLLYGTARRTPSTPLPVCPACLFDDDYPWPLDPDVLDTAFTTWFTGDLGTPAAWTGVAALIGTLASTPVRDNTDPAWFWSQFDWARARDLWVWLPTGPHRPEMLDTFGVGASLGAILDVLAMQRPNLIEETIQAYDTRLSMGAEDDGPDEILLPELWPAVVVLSLTLTTQSQDHPERRSPWHLMTSMADGGALGQALTAVNRPDVAPYIAEQTITLAQDLAWLLGLPVNTGA